ncbi:MAG: hypothetical protein BalsKO_06780 [Balneolaceae bacterium]
MKKKRLYILVIVTLFFLVGSIQAQDIVAEDHASNYTSEQFEALENLGTGFGAWTRTISGDDADILLQDASGNGTNSAVINTEGLAFALIASAEANRGQRVDLGREFGSTLSDGDVLSFEIGWSWTDGIKGFTLYNGNWDSAGTVLTIDFDATGFYANGDSVAAPAGEDDWNGDNPWRQQGEALRVSITKSGENLDYSVVAITEESSVDFSGTLEGVNVDRINFFNDDGPNWGGTGQGSIFVNSLKITSSEATNNEETGEITAFRLDQNYPNPFNPTTSISYTLAESGRVQLAIYNMLGQKLQVLENGLKSAGSHIARFDASTLNSGIYIYQLTTPNGTLSRKMTLLK